MKHILSFCLVVLLSVVPGQACIKKAPSLTSPLTIIVMDTTQALLANAEIRVGKTVYRTSWDGRVRLEPDQLKGVSKLLISCDNHDSKKLVLSDAISPVSEVRLVPKKQKKPNDHAVLLGGVRSRRGIDEVMYRTSAMGVKADYAVMNSAALPEAAEEVMPLPMPGHSEQVVAGKLTAGEVNDFAKWYFWPSIIDGSHQRFVDTWKISPRHRYTVQVMNRNGYPLASRAVSLLDNSGNTLFQAVTDNTGKAELWYQLLGSQLCGKHVDFQIRVDDQTQVAKQWVEGGNTFVMDEECGESQMSTLTSPNSNDVDVMFVFDATGSMGDELRYLCAEMKDVIARSKEATGGLSIRTGAVVYRDHGDDYVTRISRLTDDITTTQTFIDKQEAQGGGDYPEAVPEALMAAMNSAGWNESARARIAFLILDAPAHQDSATIALLHEQVLNAAALGVRIVPVVCSGIGESGEYLMRSIALATNGTSFFLTDDSGIGHTHLKPTTDTLTVEHLNDMMVRTIVEFSTMPSCLNDPINDQMVNDQMVNDFIPNPFETSDLESGEVTVPYGEGILYIVDISGKLIRIVEGSLDSYQLPITNHQLPIGIYFIKAYINGQWYTRKILVH